MVRSSRIRSNRIIPLEQRGQFVERSGIAIFGGGHDVATRLSQAQCENRMVTQ